MLLSARPVIRTTNDSSHNPNKSSIIRTTTAHIELSGHVYSGIYPLQCLFGFVLKPVNMPPTRKHFTLSIKDKIEIIRSLETGSTVTALSLKYKVGKSTICDIKKNKNNFLTYATSASSLLNKRKTLKLSAYPEVDRAVYTWFLQERSRGAPISGEILCEKAKFFYSQTRDGNNFKASSGWLEKFKKRYGIRQLSITGEKLSSDTAAVEPFKKILQAKIKELHLTADQIYNADESGLFWKLLPQKTLAHQAEESAPGRKMSKERITFMPCANASGTHKLKLLVLGKSQKPRSFKNTGVPVSYKGQKKAWVTKEIFEEWFSKEFVPAVRKKMLELNLPPKALLILDNAPGHPVNLHSDDQKITVMFLPPNVTPLVQPMDQNVIQVIKLNYRKALLRKIVSSEDPDLTAQLKKVTLRDVVFDLDTAWNNVTPKLIQKSWNQLLAKQVEGIWDKDDDISLSQLREKLLVEGVDIHIREVTELVNHISQDITNQEVVEWAIGQEEAWEWISDVDIVEQLQNESSESDESEEIEIVEKVTHKEAIKSFNTCLKWAQQNFESEHHVFILEELKKRARIAEAGNIKQTKITSYFKKPINN